KLDKEEAKTYLSSYISHVTKKALSYIREDKNSNDEEALILQIRTCNEIIQLLSSKLKDEESASWKLEEKGEILTSIYNKINNVRAIQKKNAIRPVTSISQSSLFTGSHYE